MNKKLEKLLSKSKELAIELKAKEEEKARIDSEIERLKMQELKAFLISNNMGLDDEFYDMARVVKQMIDSGITSKDIKEMVGIKVNSSSTPDRKKPMEERNEK